MAKKSRAASNPGRTSIKRVAGLVVLAAVLALGVFTVTRLRDHSDSPAASASGIRPAGSIDYSPAKPGDNTANDQRKGSSNPSTTIPESTPNSGSGTSTKPSISIAGANPNGRQSIIVSATISGTTSGTCTFSFSKTDNGAAAKTYAEPITFSGTYYTCPAHTVEMPSGGNWYVSATLSSGGQTARDKWPTAVTL